jgi:AcrR family transcriptional regulator
MTGPGRVTMRSDAEANRARILDAARMALTASSDATMNSIARLAGVGQGTMYRHFPSREALLLAVYRADVQALIDAAPALLDAHPPARALRLWLDRLASYGRIKHGVAQAVAAATQAGLSGAYYQPVTGAIGLLLAAGQRDGSLRPDVDADDVLELVGFLWRMGNAGWEQRARRRLDIVMAGLGQCPDQDG